MEFNYGKFSAPVNALIASVLSLLIIFLTGTVLPLFQLLMIFPFTVLWVSEGWRWTALAYLITAIASSLIFGPAVSIVYMPFVIILSMLMGTLIERKASLFHELMIPGMAYMALGLLMLWIGMKYGGIDLAKIIDEATKTQLPSSLMEGSVGPEIELAISKAIEQVKRLLPAILLLMGFLTAVLTSTISRSMLVATGEDTQRFALSRFEIPKPAGRLVLILAIIAWACASFIGPQFLAFKENLFFVTFWIFAFNGLALMNFRFRLRGTGSFIRVLISILLLLFVITLIFLFVVGLIDFFVRFRSRSQGGKHDPSK